MKRHHSQAAACARLHSRLPVAAALAACLGAAPAHAQPAEEPTTLPAVRVTGTGETATGPVEGYVARRSATGTKTDTPLSETPHIPTRLAEG